ncbi:ElaB/YqjD/DUF883 family membrane-anchored ribosome-binding protein [Sphingomonas sp. BE123]|uniref:DUF883 C-terminal domain-containing protein n=1 Tax=Sphingomonas sp. BE123 TaxID=2817842 RepID=UPI00285B9EF5|nr:DUF883 C-terminal domain-containing protein [Sphingomonas sp. BE123]MDR6850880.1 ElaB/YqjD/DUF883 family membrane-anchored ribosome-binding protein [Sphingomonas sp. BE123]
MADETFPKDQSMDPATDALVATRPAGSTTDEPGKRSAGAFVRDEAGKLAGQAGDKARSFADTGKEKATGALDEFSNLMRDAAGTVDEKLGEQYGQYARSAADQISGLAESLRGKQVDDLLDDAREFVEKSPAVAVGIAAGVGFVLARLLKSGLDAAGDLADKGDPNRSDPDDRPTA